MKPALTREQWATVKRGGWYFHDAGIGILEQGILKSDHAAAAILLYEQPFGFTQEDVRALRGYNYLFGTTPPDLYYKAFESLVERIAALLPPETT